MWEDARVVGGEMPFSLVRLPFALGEVMFVDEVLCPLGCVYEEGDCP